MSAAPREVPVTFVTARDEKRHVATLWVVGELDEFTVAAFEAELERLVPTSRSLVIELSSCTFISSVALAALMRLRRRVPNHAIVLVTNGEHMSKLIRITGLERLFPRFENVVDALVAVGKPDLSPSASSATNGDSVARRLPLRHWSRRELRIVQDG